MRVPLTYKVTFLFQRADRAFFKKVISSAPFRKAITLATAAKFKLVRVASHTHWPDTKDMTAFEAILEPGEVLRLLTLGEADIKPQEKVFGDPPRQAARYTLSEWGTFKALLHSLELHTLQVQALMDTDTVRDTADRNYDLVGFDDAMVWGAIYVPKAVQEVETILRTLTLPNGVTLCYRDYDGIQNTVNSDNPENFQFPTHIGLEGVGQKFLFPLEDTPNSVLVETTDTHLPIHDVNGVEIREGMTVRTQQPSGGILEPSTPKTGIVGATVDSFGIPTLQIRYTANGHDRFILLNGKINEVLPS